MSSVHCSIVLLLLLLLLLLLALCYSVWAGGDEGYVLIVVFVLGVMFCVY